MNDIEAFINEVAIQEGSDAAISAAYRLRSELWPSSEHHLHLNSVIDNAETDDALIGIIIGRGIIGNKRLFRRLKSILNDKDFNALEGKNELELLRYLIFIRKDYNDRDEINLQHVIRDITNWIKRRNRRAASATRRTSRAEQFRQFRARRLARARTQQDARFQKGEEGVVVEEEDLGAGSMVVEGQELIGCASCGKHSGYRCKRCRRVHYCSRGCQKKHWCHHKHKCRSYY
jgi:hypothetical protein